MAICVCSVSLARCGPLAGRGPRFSGRRLVALPVAEQALDLVAQRLPLDIAGHGQDGAARPEQAADGVCATSSMVRLSMPSAVPRRSLLERRRIVLLAQLDQAPSGAARPPGLQVLQGQGLDRVEFLFGQVRPAQDVGVDFQGGRQVAGQRRAPEAHVHDADAFAAVQAEVVQGQGQFPAVAVAGAAGDQVGEDEADAELSGGS